MPGRHRYGGKERALERREEDEHAEARAKARLRDLRDSIDNIDAALIHLLAERFKLTGQVGELKADRGLPPADPSREAEQIERLQALAVDAKLDPEFAKKFLAFIIEEVIRHHESVAMSR